nr:MAG TPA: hypothetical protein [Caudoviricetes sp.]
MSHDHDAFSIAHFIIIYLHLHIFAINIIYNQTP